MIAGSEVLIAAVIATVLLALLTRFSPALALSIWVTESVVFNKYVFSQGMSISHLHPSHLLLAGLLVGFLSRGIWQLRQSAPGHPELFMIAFAVWAIATGFISGNLFRGDIEWTVGTMVNGFLIPVLILCLARATPPIKSSRRIVCNVLMLLLAYLIFTAFCEHFKFDRFVFPHYILDPSIGLHPDRARGPITNAAENGGIIGILIIVALHRIAYIKASFTRSMAFCALLIGALPALYFTQTRGPWLAFAGGLLVMLWHQRSRARVLIIGACIVAALTILHFASWKIMDKRSDGDPTETTDFRLTLYRESLDAFQEHPIIGWGLGSFTSINHPLGAGNHWQILGKGDVQHDTIVAIATENGIIGVTLFVAFFISQFRSFKRLRRVAHTLEQRDFYTLGWAVLTVLLINGTFADFRDWMSQNSIVFLITGLGLAIPIGNAVRPPVSDISPVTAMYPPRCPVTRSAQ
jgi:O-antigen ligase